jgi:fucose permease
MGRVGDAVTPQRFAYLKKIYDFQLVYMEITVCCYAYIVYYGLHGHTVGTRVDDKSSPTIAV